MLPWFLYLLIAWMTPFFSLTRVLFTLFVNVSGLEGTKVHDYLTTFYIIYQNYNKLVFNLHFRKLFSFLAQYPFRPGLLCWLSSMLKSKISRVSWSINFTTCLMSFNVLTFIGHVPLGKALAFGRSDILFRSEKTLEIVCDEAINETCDDFWSLGAVFTHVVPWNGKINFSGPRNCVYQHGLLL
jgi:hypothetical protein